jgi:glycosyltransferase involved in cell wall biosynthesis
MISIITPVLNGERHIGICIESVLKQNYSPIEHLIIDGKSTDGTMAIVKKYAAKYGHIRWISEKDHGQSNAMNKGIGLAKGQIIGILNIDDYYQPGVLNRISNIFKTLPGASLLVGNCNVWNSSGELLYVNRPRRLKVEDLLMGWRVNPHPVNPSAYFYHKSLHDIVGPYDENEHFALDVDFLLKAVRFAHVKYVDELWGNYCFLPGTKTETDQRRGTNVDRINDLFLKHRKGLPILKQFKVILMQLWYEQVKMLKNIKIKVYNYMKKT